MRLLVALTLIATLSSCFSDRSSVLPQNSGNLVTKPNSQEPTSVTSTYPPEVIANFMTGCTTGQPSEMEKTCGCIIQQIKNQYTYDQYQALSEKDFTEDSVVQDAIKFCSEAETINRPLAQAPRIKNSYIVGQDDTFLGEVSSSQVAAKSICNQVGKYGSQVATTSIRNQVAKYGNQVSKLSAYNPYAQNPPILIQV